MAKAKIGFEVDEGDLANAKAYVALHGGSLNKLVSALFASLGKDDAQRVPVPDPALSVLMAVSTGKMSVMDAAQQQSSTLGARRSRRVRRAARRTTGRCRAQGRGWQRSRSRDTPQ